VNTNLDKTGAERKISTLARRMTLVLTAGALAAAPALALPADPKAAPAGAPAAAAAPAAPVKPADGAAPKMVLTSDRKEYGDVPKGEMLEHDFVVKNTGNADLLITDVKPACGCTLQKFDKVIKPGAEGKVHLSVDTRNFQGPISKTALIMTNDPTTPQVTVFMMANVKPFVETLPYGFFSLRGISGEEVTSELTLISEDPKFKPTNVTVTGTITGPGSAAQDMSPFVKASVAQVAEKERVAGKGPNQWKLKLTVAKEAAMGILNGQVRLETGIAKQPETTINISGSIADAVGVVPTQLTFGEVDLKAPVTKEVDVINRNAKNADFQVTGATTSVPGIKAEVKPQGGGRVKVVLSVDPKTVKKGKFDGDLTINTNDPTKKSLKVAFSGTVS